MRALTFFVVGMIDHVAMLFNLFFALILLVLLVLTVFPLGPDGGRDWFGLALPAGLYFGTLLIRLVCQRIMRLLQVNPYPPLKPLDISRYLDKGAKQ